MKTYNLFWAPEGRQIATVQARTMRAFIAGIGAAEEVGK